ncbi:tripartite tricarboxylate transporter TctB family protein [Aminobacter sp. J44]|uniref:tripartite tricarboxylate transporter TctB family protein n=1 Tax=Aminobacter sp. J44 TaxID=935262 RepID=UPI00119B817B|nr:tripartite tricarboxylate transporter TctB family protein [Aminobacter sp. J44]TWG61366.1 tripartite tricarboxylate transporter TctB family protein [Aminobacter sp. J44]
MSSAENIEQGGGNTAALLAQKLIIAVAALACFAVFFRSAWLMPPVRAAGDVGSAFLPLVMAVIGFGLSLIYLVQVLTGRDDTKALAHPMALVLLVLTLGTVALIYGLGMPVALGAGAAIMVLVLERGKAPLWAAGTGIVFWALTKFGFGTLLGVPLM